MNARVPSDILSSVVPGQREPTPDIRKLDFLGRMPIPLRRSFKAGLDKAVAAHRGATGDTLQCCFLSGAEWYRPFDGLESLAVTGEVPAMLVSTFYHDIFSPALMNRYAPGAGSALAPLHPVCARAGLADPEGVFKTFSAIPFVFLVDEMRLKGRPLPRCWEDLLDPMWADDIVFGGWRPNEHSPYQEYNSYLLLSLYLEYGASGLEAFAANVRHLQHNIRTATQAGSNSPSVGAIAILPWLQADLSPRRQRTHVIWPDDGALVMPIGYMVRRNADRRVAPLVDYLCGRDLGEMLARNCYPPTLLGAGDGFPADARLKWAGWQTLRGLDLAETSRVAARHFFDTWSGKGALRACA